MRNVVEYRNRKAGIVITLTVDAEGIYRLTFVEKYTTHTARGWWGCDEEHARSLARGYALTFDATETAAPAPRTQMVSPLAPEHQAAPVRPLSDAEWLMLSYALRFGYVQPGKRQHDAKALRELAAMRLVTLDMDPVIRFRVRGAWPTDKGRAVVDNHAARAA